MLTLESPLESPCLLTLGFVAGVQRQHFTCTVELAAPRSVHGTGHSRPFLGGGDYDHGIMTRMKEFGMKTMAAGSFKVHCLAVMDEVQAKRTGRLNH
jgi:hypothetical protein